MIAEGKDFEMILLFQGDFELLGFALNNCTVEISPERERYLRVVHRTALELAVQNQYGVEIGGFWLLTDQITQLRRLPEYYSPNEAPIVADVVEAYLTAQLSPFDKTTTLQQTESHS